MLETQASETCCIVVDKPAAVMFEVRIAGT